MGKQKIVRTAPAVTRTWMQDADWDVICKAFHGYKGQAGVFESAVGALIVGRLLGFQALQVLHSWKTLREYEKHLGIVFKEVLPARTEESQRLAGIRRADTFRQFWKAIAAGVGSEDGAKEVLQ
ncbi:MAG TPA: hypothetical protein VHY37_01645 [Tepidisphaeraceae bacterium]|jgi:hypothetical protein|nr:hypothetical protein [Tepidisphaeraceae bacterium]